jgi:hypothetical protein
VARLVGRFLQLIAGGGVSIKEAAYFRSSKHMQRILHQADKQVYREITAIVGITPQFRNSVSGFGRPFCSSAAEMRGIKLFYS